MKISIVRPFLPKIEQINNDFAECLNSGMVTNNSKNLVAFEDSLQSFLGSKLKPLVFNNGELALFNLIHAYKIKMGLSPHESFDVLVPSFTFSGTINAIVMNNLKPVFCDVDSTLTIDIKKCRVADNVKMMVVVGAYGNLPNIESVLKFASDNNIAVIFDNAPAFAAKFKGKYVSNYGFSETYSFHASKLFNTMEGGAAVTNDEEIRNHLVDIRDFGQYEKKRGNVRMPGLNSKMPEICAIIGLNNLKNINFILEKRFENINKYKEFFRGLAAKKYITEMQVMKEVECTYLYYPVILESEATDFVDYMADKDIMVRRYYTAVHDLDFYKNTYSSLNLDYTNSIKDRVVAVPIHTIMSDDEINYLFKTISNFFEK